jgi:hypothetical protein
VLKTKKGAMTMFVGHLEGAQYLVGRLSPTFVLLSGPHSAAGVKRIKTTKFWPNPNHSPKYTLPFVPILCAGQIPFNSTFFIFFRIGWPLGEFIQMSFGQMKGE